MSCEVLRDGDLNERTTPTSWQGSRNVHPAIRASIVDRA